jgi:glutamyl-Q tRNA(Asp) synthetase
VVTRFAPSPTGHLHLGHVYAAWVAWQAARRAGGRFLVRLEDIDPQRCRPAFATALLEDLAWLGLHWDGAVRVQSAHLDEYGAVLDGLRARGLIYPCFCSRAGVVREIAAAGGAPHGAPHDPVGAAYPGTCRPLPAGRVAARMAAGEPYVWRLDLAAALRVAAHPQENRALRFHEDGVGWVAVDARRFGDVVLGRRDVAASYHLCVTHDDAAQGVSLVTRGEDLRGATHLHVVLQHVMRWPTPAYAHHRLLVGPDGRRLAKRDGATSVRALRAAGVPAAEVLRRAGAGVGTVPGTDPGPVPGVGEP